MAQLRQDYDQFVKREAQIVVLGPEGPDDFKKYWKANDLPFIGLPDPTHAVLTRYGQRVNLFKFGRMPAQAVIDKAGTVRYVHYGNSMSDIPDNASLLAILDQLNDTKTGSP